MDDREHPHLEIRHDGPVARLWLDRPEVHNAFDDALMHALTVAFERLGSNATVRVIVLGGRGKSFCAGADVHWMKRVTGYSQEENLRDAAVLQAMLTAVNECPKPVIARVHGAALGGGTGLVSACDIVVAVPDAIFGATEVKLGLLPAVISPFLVARIGPSHARDICLTGERIPAERAAAMGLVTRVVTAGELDGFIEQKIDLLLASGPGAVAATKSLIREVAWRQPAEVAARTLAAIAAARVSPEGQEGMAAFLERRAPSFKLER